MDNNLKGIISLLKKEKTEKKKEIKKKTII